MSNLSPYVLECINNLRDALYEDSSPTEVILHTYGEDPIIIDKLSDRQDITYVVSCSDGYDTINDSYKSISDLRKCIDKTAYRDLRKYRYVSGHNTYRRCLKCKENNCTISTIKLTSTLYEDSCQFCGKNNCTSIWEYLDIIEGYIVRSYDHKCVIGTITAIVN